MKTKSILFAVLCGLIAVVTARAADRKPNILFIMGDDIGIWNLSTYHQGIMG